MNILGWVAVDRQAVEGSRSSGYIYSKKPVLDNNGSWYSPEGGRLLGNLLAGKHNLKPGECKRISLAIFEDSEDDKGGPQETESKKRFSDEDKRRIEDVFAILKDIMED
jgi:hypothetical protein